MSFMSGGSQDAPIMPGYGSPQLAKFMDAWRKQQRSKQGMESTVLGDWGGGDTKPNTVLGDAWLTR